MHRLTIWMAMVCVGLCASCLFGAPGDWVTLHLEDGRVLSGEVLEETPDGIRINCHLAGIVSEMQFAARDVVEIEREEGVDQEAVDDARVRHAEGELDRGRVKERGGYVVVPAEGAIGVELTTFFFRETCEKAIASGADLVIYDLESPGGYLHILWDIRQTLDAYEDQIQIAFYADGDCFSAAALLCMSSQHFYVGDDAAFGAAVIWQTGEDGQPTAVDAKFAAAEASKWRREAEKRGRPGVVIDALIRQEAQVWADQSKTPWTLYPGRREGGDAALTELDSGRSVLSMTGSEGVEMGAADGMVDHARDIAGRVEISRDGFEALEGDDTARIVAGIQQRNIKGLRNRLDQVSKNLSRMQKKASRGDLSQSGARREVRSLMQIGRAMLDMYDELDYVRDHLHAEYGITRGVLEQYIEEMNAIRMALDGR